MRLSLIHASHNLHLHPTLYYHLLLAAGGDSHRRILHPVPSPVIFFLPAFLCAMPLFRLSRQSPCCPFYPGRGVSRRSHGVTLELAISVVHSFGLD